MERPRVVAVIVTRNRLELLKVCLRAVLCQTRPVDQIVVIDNDSSDGTAEWLAEQKALTIRQDNCGGAGGFHRGICEALKRDADWIWLMDDDGVPDESALEKLLLKIRPGRVAVNSLVLAIDDPSRLSFGFPIAAKNGFPSLRTSIWSLPELLARADEENTVDFAAFFNGSLIRAETLREVGNVIKELFIWGDELDLYWRLAARGEIRTVLDAIHYHPEPMSGTLPVWKMYYGLRNGIYINQQHLDRKLLRNLRQIAKYAMLFLPRPRDWKWFFYAISDGLRGNITVRIEP